MIGIIIWNVVERRPLRTVCHRYDRLSHHTSDEAQSQAQETIGLLGAKQDRPYSALLEPMSESDDGHKDGFRCSLLVGSCQS